MVSRPRPASLALARLIQRHSRLQPALEVTHLEVKVEGLPAALEGFRIAHVSDIHVGEDGWMPFRADEAAEALGAAQPQLVVNTGDYLLGQPPVHAVVEVARAFLAPRRNTMAQPADLAILGNHDYFASESVVAALVEGLERLGIVMLINQVIEVRWRGATLTVGGLVGSQPAFEEAVQALSGASGPRVVLVHEPDIAERLSPGAADLVLAGHSHGGQIAIPGLTRRIVHLFNGSRYVDGFYAINGNRVYVNRGLGTTGLPVRFRAAPELTILQLVR